MGTGALVDHGLLGETDRDAVFDQAERWNELEMTRQGELAIVVERVGRKFVEAMAVEVTFPIRIPASAGQRFGLASNYGRIA